MLARAVVVQRRRRAAGARQRLRRGLVQRPVGAAGERAGVEPGRAQHALDAGDMRRLAAVRRAGERELLVAEAVAVGAARLDQHQRLQRLDGRAGKHRRRDVAERQHGRAVGVDHRHGAAVAALDQVAARHFDQDRIGHRRLRRNPVVATFAKHDHSHFARHGHPPQDASKLDHHAGRVRAADRGARRAVCCRGSPAQLARGELVEHPHAAAGGPGPRRRACWCSRRAPAGGRACSRSTPGWWSSRRTPPPTPATT